MTDGAPNPRVMVPDMCDQHCVAFFGRAGLTEQDAWQVAEITLNLYLFQTAARNPEVTDRLPRDADGKWLVEDLSAHLNEHVGCLACLDPDAFNQGTDIYVVYGLQELARRAREGER